MPGVARFGDLVQCVCPIHGPQMGTFITGDTTVLTDNLATVRLTDQALLDCGDIVLVTVASTTVNATMLGKARMGDPVVSTAHGSTGVILTASVTSLVDDNISTIPLPPTITPEEIAAVVPAENIQPNVDPVDTVTYSFIEDGDDPDFPGPVPPARTQAQSTAIAYVEVDDVAGSQTPAAEDDAVVPDGSVPTLPPHPISQDCNTIPADPPVTMRLSTNYNLSSLTTNTAMFKYPLRAQSVKNVAYSKAQIACNLSKLAVNLLEPIKVQYPGFIITSAFRHGDASSKSNHNKGCAADIQWPSLNGSNYVAGVTEQEYYNRIVWIRDNLRWNELIMEYGGQSGPWLHVSFKDYGPDANNRTNFKTLTNLKAGTYVMGKFLLLKNDPGRGGKAF